LKNEAKESKEPKLKAGFKDEGGFKKRRRLGG
jgi:hypothetical protein